MSRFARLRLPSLPVALSGYHGQPSPATSENEVRLHCRRSVHCGPAEAARGTGKDRGHGIPLGCGTGAELGSPGRRARPERGVRAEAGHAPPNGETILILAVCEALEDDRLSVMSREVICAAEGLGGARIAWRKRWVGNGLAHKTARTCQRWGNTVSWWGLGIAYAAAGRRPDSGSRGVCPKRNHWKSTAW